MLVKLCLTIKCSLSRFIKWFVNLKNAGCTICFVRCVCTRGICSNEMYNFILEFVEKYWNRELGVEVIFFCTCRKITRVNGTASRSSL